MEILLIELKARINNVNDFKKRLSLLDAKYVGKFHQIDTYFKVPQGRLKIRETENKNSAEVVFYKRPNVPDIKKSHILLIQVQPPETAKELLSKFFSTKIVVDKIREIFIIGETRIHLDEVAGLGTFVEFELPTANKVEEINNSKSLLANLCVKLGIKKEDLEALSYADLLAKKSGEVSESVVDT
jgi:predicted adenylyl cyclase CyaB